MLLLSKKGLFFPTKKKVLRNFKNKLFPTKNLEPDVESEWELEQGLQSGPEPKPKYKKFSLKLCDKFLN